MTVTSSHGPADTIVDANTGETLTILEAAQQSGGERVVMRLTLAPNTGVPAHSHPVEESFQRLQGDVELIVDGRPAEIGAGKVVTVPPGHLHSLRNASPQPSVLRVVGRPGAETEFGLRLKFQLSRDGFIPVPGGRRPRNPLVGAIVIQRGGLYFPPLPRWLFRSLMSSLAALGRWRGRERYLLANYPDYGRWLDALGVARPPVEP